jgi:hypothetical protein
VISRDDLPDTPDWSVTRHPCPFERCYVCEPHEGGGTYPLPETIILSDN